MKPVLRLIDADPVALEVRVARAMDELQRDCIVDRFTHWYTTRPPAYEAVLLVA